MQASFDINVSSRTGRSLSLDHMITLLIAGGCVHCFKRLMCVWRQNETTLRTNNNELNSTVSLPRKYIYGRLTVVLCRWASDAVTCKTT